MVSEMSGRVRGSYGNILQNNYNSRSNTFGTNRAISLDHYSNHRRMSDGIQTVTSDSTVYYHQRLHDQDNLLLRAAAAAGKSASQMSTEVKLLVSSGEEPMNSIKCPIQSTMAVSSSAVINNDNVSDLNRVQSSNNSSNNNNNNNCSNNSNVLTSNTTATATTTATSASKSNVPKSKINNNSSVTCSNSPKSIITRLRQLTGRLSFSFDKDASRRISTTGSTPQATIIKTSTSPSKNNNMMPNICCNTTKSAIGSANANVAAAAAGCNDASTRNRAYSLDVPPMKFNYNSSGASSNNGSHKSLSSSAATNRNEESVIINDDSTDTNSAVYASKKMSAAEVESMDIWQTKNDDGDDGDKAEDGEQQTETYWTTFTNNFRRIVCKCCEKEQQVPTASV